MVSERERALDRLCLRRCDVERARDRHVKSVSAPVEHARELARLAVRDGEGRAVVANRDDDEGGLSRRVALFRRLTERAEERERLEVDPGKLDSGLLAGGDIALDEVAVGNDEQDPPGRRALGVGRLAQHVVVEHRLFHRNRQHFLRAVANRVLELLRIVDSRDLEHTDTDAVVGDSEPDVLARQLVLAEEILEGHGQNLGLTQLPADDHAALEVFTGHLDEFGGAVVDDAGGRELRCTDLQADELAYALGRT